MGSLYFRIFFVDDRGDYVWWAAPGCARVSHDDLDGARSSDRQGGPYARTGVRLLTTAVP